MRLTTRDVARIRELRYGDGLSTAEVARIVGCSVLSVRRWAPGYLGKVDNAKLRAAFLASGLTAAEVARRMGWTYVHVDRWVSSDGSRVKHTLGLVPDVNGKGVRTRRRLIDTETAALMAEAIGVMPWEIMPDDEAAA